MVLAPYADAVPMGAPDPALASNDFEGDQNSVPLSADARVQAICDCLLRVVYRGHTNAQEWNRPFHDRMQLYRRLRRAISPYDGDPSDPLSELYSPTIGSLIETSKAQELSTLVPDPASMDNVEVHPEEEGLDEYCEAMTRKLRADYIAMRPQDCENGILDLTDQQIEDRYVTGNAFETSAFQVYSGEHDGEPYVAGVTKERPDPVNVFPWNGGITSSVHQKFTIYDPCSEDDLERMGIPDDILQLIRDKCVYQPLPSVDPETQDQETQLTDDTYYNLNQNMNAFKRIVYSGKFPWGEFRREWGEKRDDLPDRPEIVMALAGVYGFDVASVTMSSYWDIQWVYPILARCRPLQIELPPGAGPIRHAVQYRVANQFWGEGFYDRAQMHERLANFFQQCAARIAGLLADPPTIFRKYLLDMDQLQLNGITPRLEHGMALYAKQGMAGDHSPPVEALQFNAASLPAMMEQEAGQKEQIRQITGIYADLQGQSQTKTATQGANNLQQGLMLLQASAERFENGFCKRGAEADYVILCQAIRMGGQAVKLPMSVENKVLSSLTVTPEMLLPLGPVSIRMTGANNPSNRVHMVETLLNYCKVFMMVPGVDVQLLAKMVAQYMDLPHKDQIVSDPSGMTLNKRIINAKQILSEGGDAALQLFTPMELMQAQVLSQPPMQPAPMGPDGKPMPGQQPLQGGAPPAAPQMQPSGPIGGAPMMPGNNGFSGTQ